MVFTIYIVGFKDTWTLDRPGPHPKSGPWPFHWYPLSKIQMEDFDVESTAASPLVCGNLLFEPSQAVW